MTRFQELFDYMSSEHGVTLTESDMWEVARICERINTQHITHNSMQHNDGYDAYYEAEGHAAAAEAQAREEQEYQDYLGKLLEKGETALFAAHVSIDWLQSKEFTESGLSAVEFIKKKKEKFQSIFNERSF
jgi:hypothetical protein